jgi:hypothetical protein
MVGIVSQITLVALPSLKDIFSPVNGLWIRTQDPDFRYWNPVIEGLDSKAELAWASIEYTYALPDVSVHPIPF